LGLSSEMADIQGHAKGTRKILERGAQFGTSVMPVLDRLGSSRKKN
jgi:hypothetical protein